METTRRVQVGSVAVGGGAPVAVQSMLSCPTDDPEACLAQIEALHAVGCEIVRLAIPRADVLDGFGEVCARSPLPVVADIHFDYRLALGAIERGAAKLRINPGNIGSEKKVDAVIEAAGAAGIPIRIGGQCRFARVAPAREGRLDALREARESARLAVAHFEQRGFAISSSRRRRMTWCRPSRPTGCSPRSCPRCRCISASPKLARFARAR